MPNPDLAPLERALSVVERRAGQQPDPYADGPAYGQERADIQDAIQRAWGLRDRIARMEADGKQLRQKIGIARRQLGVPDESHAARVARLSDGRADSTTDCTLDELRAILAEYQACGFRVRPPKRAASAIAPSAEQLADQALPGKIQALLADQRLPWTYAEAILRRQRGILDRGVRCPLGAITPREARGLIAALSKRQARQRRGSG